MMPPTFKPPDENSRPERVWFPDELLWPINIWPSVLPLTIVCGPPAAGKTTNVEQQRAESDVVIDLDEIVRELGGDARTDDRELRKQALKDRNRRLQALADERPGCRAAWFITTAPQADARRRWAELLKPCAVLVFLTPVNVCVMRIDGDHERSQYRQEQVDAAVRWWRDYTPRRGDTVVEWDNPPRNA